jgi:hypothetical protein
MILSYFLLTVLIVCGLGSWYGKTPQGKYERRLMEDFNNKNKL